MGITVMVKTRERKPRLTGIGVSIPEIAGTEEG